LTTFLALLLTVVLTALSFPPFDFGLAAFAALVPLMTVTGRGGSGRRDLIVGWLAGWAASTAVVWWVVNTIVHYGGISWVLAVPIVLLLTWALGFFWGLFAWARGRILKSGAAAYDFLISPLLWVATEYARAHLADLAFPWALQGYTQYRNLPFIQVADLGGVWVVSFLVVMVNGALAGLVSRQRPAAGARGLAGRLVPLGAAGLLVSSAWVYGLVRMGDEEEGKTVRVGVVQGNIEQEVKWDPAHTQATLDLYAGLSREAARDGAELIVWPETAAPFYFQRAGRYRRQVTSLAEEVGIPLLVGSPAVEGTGPTATLRNRAYLLGADGDIRGWYDKHHLVPFGEFVPWKKLLFFVDKIVAAVGEFKPGEGAVVLDIPAGRFGTLICYEVIFPDLVRKSVVAGAEFLVNITNDAWFGRTAASQQHFTALVFRAVENRRPVARAANSGISGFVDSRGRILAASALFVRGTYSETLRLSEEDTLYSRWGDYFPRICALAGLVFVLQAVRRRGCENYRP
jgi:apolipoprotein N-acyltransferase